MHAFAHFLAVPSVLRGLAIDSVERRSTDCLPLSDVNSNITSGVVARAHYIDMRPGNLNVDSYTLDGKHEWRIQNTNNCLALLCVTLKLA